MESESGHFRGARCYQIDAIEDDVEWVWMEDCSNYRSGTSWTEDDYLLAAQAIGEFNAGWLHSQPIHSPYLDTHPVLKELPQQQILMLIRDSLIKFEHSEYVREALPGDSYAKAMKLFEYLEPLAAKAKTLPSTFAHNDCHVRNLFVNRNDRERPEVVAIDFGRVGIEHVGIDAGDLFGSGFTRTDHEARILMEMVDRYFAGWAETLAGRGVSMVPAEVRFAFLMPLMRRTLNVAGLPALVEAGHGEFPLQRYGGAPDDYPFSMKTRFEYLLPLCEEAIAIAGLD